MNRALLHVGGWTFLAVTVAIQYWVGGVIMETKFEAGQHFVRLRDGAEHWVSVSAFVFWMNRLIDGVIILMVASGFF